MFEQFVFVDNGTKFIILLLFAGPFSLCILFFIYLKNFMRVGEIDLWHFGFFYIIALAILGFGIIPNFHLGKVEVIFLDWSGLIAGVPFGIICYNVYSGDVKLMYFIHLDYERQQADIYSSYVYERDNQLYIIIYDFLEKEGFWEFFRRMFGIRVLLHWTVSPSLYFKEHKVNELYFVEELYDRVFFESSIEERVAKDDNGRILRDRSTGEIIYEDYEKIHKWLGLVNKRIRVKVATPVQAMRYSWTEFLTRFKDYEDMQITIGNLYELNMKLKATTKAMSYKIAEKMIRIIDQAKGEVASQLVGDIAEENVDRLVESVLEEDVEEEVEQMEQEREQGVTE